MREVQAFLKECEVYFLATLDGDQPRVRPFGTAEVIDNHLYIETSKKKEVFKQIEKNSKVEICAYKNGKWIRVTGKLVVDDRLDIKEMMFEKDPMLKDMYDVYSDNTAVLYFTSGEAIISSFTEKPKVIKL